MCTCQEDENGVVVHECDSCYWHSVHLSEELMLMDILILGS